VPFEAALLQAKEQPVYQQIAEEAVHLRLLGMNANRIAGALKVDRTTVVRALRWINRSPTYPDRRHMNT
jgi:hypothetical protein